jgi:hypothetical protein
LVLRLETCEKRAAIELGNAQALHKIEIDRIQKIAEVQKRADAERLAAYASWYRQPWFVAAVSVAATVSAVMVARYTIVR